MRTKLVCLSLLCGCSVGAQSNSTYESARSAFREVARGLVEADSTIQLREYPVSEGLVTDVVIIPAIQKPERLLIINSGIHGVEGHAGSALQRKFLASSVWRKERANTSFVLIHALNPHGFKNNRRTNASNVDLNRNFLRAGETYQFENQGYEKENAFLNPTHPASSGLIDRIGFYLRAIKEIIVYGMPTLRQAILQGQYQFSQGLYYGGAQAQPEKLNFDRIQDDLLKGSGRCFLVDLHTGYGQRGELHLMSDLREAGPRAELQKVFGSTPVVFGDTKDFYDVHGGLVQYFISTNPNHRGVTFEYGTLNSQTTLGALDSLYRMSRENQGVHQGYRTDADRREIETDFRAMFDPAESDWQERSLEMGMARLTDLLANW